MDVQKKLLVIADIGGYTRFMLATRMSLAHAQLAVTGLLEAVLDGAEELTLAKLEGDAAFFHAPEATAARLPDAIGRMRARFLAKKNQLIADRLCSCAGCGQLEELTLKFVAHAGEVAVHKVRNLEELAGVDVILVHRLLKNNVPLREYVLVTEAVLGGFTPALQGQAQRLQEDLEGLGTTTTHYVDAFAFDAPVAPVRTSKLARALSKLSLELRSLPYLLGLKKSVFADGADEPAALKAAEPR